MISISEQSLGKSALYITAKIGERLVGHVTANQMETDKLALQLLDLEVDKDFRKRSIATRLLYYCLDKARSAEKKYIFIEVDEGNSVARSFYEKNNFEQTGSFQRNNESIVQYRLML